MSRKTFYTDRDIEELAGRGVSSLEVNDDVYLTDLAREKAGRLGVRLVQENDTPSAAPIRPYISKGEDKKIAEKPSSDTKNELFEQVRAAVLKRLGGEADTQLLDVIIRRVIANIE